MAHQLQKQRSMNMSAFIFNTMILVGYLLVAAPHFASADEGGQGSGGGIVLECKPHFWSTKKEYYLADTAKLILGKELSYFEDIEDDKLIDVMIHLLNQGNPGLGDQVKTRMGMLKYVPSNQKLPLLNDDNLQNYDNDHCKKRQLGIQTFSTMTVDYDLSLLNMLKPIERQFFKVHEGLVSVLKNKYGNTGPIRVILESSAYNLQKDSYSLSQLDENNCIHANEIEISYKTYIADELKIRSYIAEKIHYKHLICTDLDSCITQIKNDFTPKEFIERFLKISIKKQPIQVRIRNNRFENSCQNNTEIKKDLLTEQTPTSGNVKINFPGKWLTVSAVKPTNSNTYVYMSIRHEGKDCQNALLLAGNLIPITDTLSGDEYYLNVQNCKRDNL